MLIRTYVPRNQVAAPVGPAPRTTVQVGVR
jgi:hypothetical protein